MRAEAYYGPATVNETPRVVLRDESGPGGTRFLGASLNESGDLVIEGQDLGSAVEELWGDHEYEWIVTVRARDLPAAVRALGGAPGTPVLELLREYTGARAVEVERRLKDAGVPTEFWSRVGD